MKLLNIMMIFKSKVKCVFCEKLTKKKTAYTINMNTAEGTHSTRACPKCAEEFDQLAQFAEKNIDKRTFTV
jgi:hypothetical protein